MESKLGAGRWSVHPEGTGRLAAIIGLLAFPVLSGCVPEIVTDTLEPRDLAPPAVESWDSTGSREFRVRFDENVTAESGEFLIVPDLGSLDILPEGDSIRIGAEADAAPGSPYSLEGLVRDCNGNTTSFVLPLWGFNPRLPRVLVNEALTQGTASHPDAVEFRVLEAGNLAGLTFFVGSSEYPVLRYLFPSCEVEAGEYLVLHLKPQGLSEEEDELEDVSRSGGLDASPGARDFWYRGGDGALSGENGAVALYRSPTGPIWDALLYSVRTSNSDTKYSGFGSLALLNQARSITAQGGWATVGDSVRPEDAAGSEGVTSTRTLCRSSNNADTNARADWHVVPTRGSTLGAANSDEVYSP